METPTHCEICSKLKIKHQNELNWSLFGVLKTNFEKLSPTGSVIPIVDLEQINAQ